MRNPKEPWREENETSARDTGEEERDEDGGAEDELFGERADEVVAEAVEGSEFAGDVAVEGEVALEGKTEVEVAGVEWAEEEERCEEERGEDVRGEGGEVGGEGGVEGEEVGGEEGGGGEGEAEKTADVERVEQPAL